MTAATEIVIDVGARLVRRGGIDVPLPPKAFDLLLLLVRSQPAAVPHDRLHAELWPGVHVSETSLAALVAQLRKALGDTSAEGRLVRTLHRVGYAFSGDAAIVGEPPAAAPIARLFWRGMRFDVAPGESVIGRDRRAAIQIDADSVSRHHARLTANAREVSIEDLGSKNGTWIGGTRISAAVPLTDGASFRLGSEIIRLELASADRSTRTVSAAANEQ